MLLEQQSSNRQPNWSKPQKSCHGNNISMLGDQVTGVYEGLARCILKKKKKSFVALPLIGIGMNIGELDKFCPTHLYSPSMTVVTLFIYPDVNTVRHTQGASTSVEDLLYSISWTLPDAPSTREESDLSTSEHKANWSN